MSGNWRFGSPQSHPALVAHARFQYVDVAAPSAPEYRGHFCPSIKPVPEQATGQLLAAREDFGSLGLIFRRANFIRHVTAQQGI